MLSVACQRDTYIKPHFMKKIKYVFKKRDCCRIEGFLKEYWHNPCDFFQTVIILKKKELPHAHTISCKHAHRMV